MFKEHESARQAKQASVLPMPGPPEVSNKLQICTVNSMILIFRTYTSRGAGLTVMAQLLFQTSKPLCRSMGC